MSGLFYLMTLHIMLYVSRARLTIPGTPYQRKVGPFTSPLLPLEV